MKEIEDSGDEGSEPLKRGNGGICFYGEDGSAGNGGSEDEIGVEEKMKNVKVKMDDKTSFLFNGMEE